MSELVQIILTHCLRDRPKDQGYPCSSRLILKFVFWICFILIVFSNFYFLLLVVRIFCNVLSAGFNRWQFYVVRLCLNIPEYRKYLYQVRIIAVVSNLQVCILILPFADFYFDYFLDLVSSLFLLSHSFSRFCIQWGSMILCIK